MTDSRAALVTVVIPTYNRLKLLRTAVESVLRQNYAPLEIIICDNASNDGTAEYSGAIAERDPRVTVVRHATNIGAGANFLFGLELAKGEFFMWVADDDWIDPGFVEHCVSGLEADTGAVLASGWSHYYDRDQGVVMRSPPVELLQTSPEERVAAFFWKVYDNGTFYGVYRRELMRRVKFAISDFGGDWLFLAELAAGGRFIGCPDAAIHRRLEGASSDLRTLAQKTDVPKFLHGKPHLWIARKAFNRISSGVGNYAVLSPRRRYTLATRAAGIIARRFGKPEWYLKWRRRLMSAS